MLQSKQLIEPAQPPTVSTSMCNLISKVLGMILLSLRSAAPERGEDVETI